jgi:nitroimidazol reductase NimA-like FMN-containing flavoprotein (pyridoxamine 5'-phosphate oxidase superfamily)
MFGKLSFREIEELLQGNIVGHLGCHSDGVTYVVPLSYAYEGSHLYFHTYEGKKVDMLRKNPSVCFQVDELKKLNNWKSVIIWGEFEELKDYEAKRQALHILLERKLPLITSETTHLGIDWPFSMEEIGEIPGVFFRISVREKTGRFERNEMSVQIPG